MKAYGSIICLVLLAVIPNCADPEKVGHDENYKNHRNQSDEALLSQLSNNEKDLLMADTMSPNKKMITMDSGLRYEIITDCPDGRQAQKGNFVEVHYTGWLNDGTDNPGKEFDSSVKRNETFEFPLGVGHVIKGWDEGVALMKVGQKIRLYIPAALGYGSRGAGAVIPPHADLIFDVELIAIS